MDYQGVEGGGVGGGGEVQGENEEEEAGHGDDGGEELEEGEVEGGGPATRHYPLIHSLAHSNMYLIETQRERQRDLKFDS